MALVIYWYDLICFAIVGVAIFISLWVITHHRGESSRYSTDSLYESLLASHGSADAGHVMLEESALTQSGCVSSSELWTTCWRGVKPIWLLILRLVSAVVMAGILLWDVRSYGSTIFIYYTEWTFALIIFYFVLGTIVSAYGCFGYSDMLDNKTEEISEYLKEDFEENKSKSTMSFLPNKISIKIKMQRRSNSEEIEGGAGFLGQLMQIVYQLMICMHSLNALFLLLDTALNNLKFPWFRLAYFVLWSCMYIIFQWVIHACGFSWLAKKSKSVYRWPYPFINLDDPWAPLWYFTLAVLHIPSYAFYALIVKVKNALFSLWFPHAYVGPC
ncbi:hypothetical protein Sjap_007017 [Stephania japonica]|uniref:Uncharacterized protein n=1 Tax=Stephania japonica TaxID=461633 RepID=A0AAP0PLM9_9MAGN